MDSSKRYQKAAGIGRKKKSESNLDLILRPFIQGKALSDVHA